MLTPLGNDRLWQSLALPPVEAWGWLLVQLLFYAGLAWKLRGRFLHWAPRRPCWRRWAALWLVPCCLEEAFWRVLLLPAPGSPNPWGAVALSAVLFVLWHPLLGRVGGPEARAAFENPRFLALALALALLNSLHYLRFGSLWPLVVFHWVAVVVWVDLLGGVIPWPPGQLLKKSA